MRNQYLHTNCVLIESILKIEHNKLHVCPCYKPGPVFPTPYAMVMFVFDGLRSEMGVRAFSTSLFELFLHNLPTTGGR